MLCPSPAAIQGSPFEVLSRQPFLLGLFLDLFGLESEAETDTRWHFDKNAELVKRADELGFEIVFSRMQWLPKSADMLSLDAFATVAAMIPLTKRILLISSMHVLYGPWHPLHLAKIGATLDHISCGRWGINVLTGHRAVEHEMFGRSQIEHDARYEMASELFDVVDRLWASDKDHSHRSRYGEWEVKNGYVTPKPRFGRPVLVAATGSEAGIDFAARHADMIFVTSPAGPVMKNALNALPAHVGKIKERARRNGRDMKVLINPVVICRETPQEAENAAFALADVHRAQRSFESDAHAWLYRKDPNADQGRGLGGNIEIVGSPEQVVEHFLALKATGIDGVQLSFRDWTADIEYFNERVIPLMKQAGLRL